ncbi:hypothetical protein QSV36_11380 [Pseudomonas sp. BCRC 81390]|uniref:hypothetical protein n=1 Tax=Pseudomonas TaxID=286 RepID=UPI002596B85E|nr:hypothetical protein [Pseudomonas sp. BCRC 81390]MDM3886190.1 hypothetical protein [Pseudomonas sp. BCRC 81390]HEP9390005.1 hypothetical protein [Pseudomonas aeruginosa]
MKYKEYLTSAKRHNHACRVLQAKLETFDEGDFNTEEFKFLVLSMYYLSGYIIECALKFKIFELKQYDPVLEVNEENCAAVGINYKKRIKTHSFSSLQNLLDSLVSGLHHTSNKGEINRLLNEWNPEIRYSHIDLEYSQIKEFYAHSNQYLRKM